MGSSSSAHAHGIFGSSGDPASPTALQAWGDSKQRTAAQSQVILLKDIDSAVCDVRSRLGLGHLLEWMDAASCLSAEKHCDRSAVTLVMDDLDFEEGSDRLLMLGGRVVLDGKVTRAFGSSMEVRVNVSVADLEIGGLKSVCNAYFMYVILKTEKEKVSKAKVAAPDMIPQSAEEHLEHGLAEKRKSFRQQRGTRVKEICLRTPSFAVSAADLELSSVSQEVHFTELVLPFHANHMGNTFGGQIMAWMVKGATSAIWLHIRMCPRAGHRLSMMKLQELYVRPVSVDQIHFKNPSHVGDRVQVLARVTRVFERSLEVLVKVTSAAVEAQRTPVEINTGYLTFAVYDENGLFMIPDVTPQTIEQKSEYKEATARQQFRLQRRETMSKSAASATGMGVDFNPDSSQAEELSIVCISDILRVNESTEHRWQTLPDSEKSADGIQIFVDLAPPAAKDAPTRMKILCEVACPPASCFKVLQDVSQRKLWDPSCADCSDRSPIKGDAEMVRMKLRLPGKPGRETELLLLRAWRADTKTNNFVVASRSVRCDSMSLSPGTEPAEILPTGYIIEESRGSEGAKAKVTFIGQFNSRTYEHVRSSVIAISKSFRNYMEALSDTRGS